MAGSMPPHLIESWGLWHFDKLRGLSSWSKAASKLKCQPAQTLSTDSHFAMLIRLIESWTTWFLRFLPTLGFFDYRAVLDYGLFLTLTLRLREVRIKQRSLVCSEQQLRRNVIALLKYLKIISQGMWPSLLPQRARHEIMVFNYGSRFSLNIKGTF